MRGLLARVLLVGVIVCGLSSGIVFAQEQELLVARPLEITEFVMLPPETTTWSLSQQTMSERGIEVLKVFESFTAKAYRDGKGYSIGYGMQTWNGRRVTRRYPGRVTMEEAHAEFIRQLPTYEQIVRELVGIDVPQEVFDAFVSIAWNLGRVNDTILNKLEQQAAMTVRDFLSTARYRGRVDWRLQGRRTREFLMALGNYEQAMMLPASRREVNLSVRELSAHRLFIFEE
jgi:lysozyme